MSTGQRFGIEAGARVGLAGRGDRVSLHEGEALGRSPAPPQRTSSPPITTADTKLSSAPTTSPLGM